MTNKRTKKSASVLLFVMVLIFAASAILVSIGEYASVALRSRASSAKEFDLRLDAYNALNVAIAVIEEYSEIDGGIFSELQGWGKPFAALLGAELSLYTLLDIIFSAKQAKTIKEFFTLLILFPIFHVAYGFGSLLGITKLFSKKFKKGTYENKKI